MLNKYSSMQYLAQDVQSPSTFWKQYKGLHSLWRQNPQGDQVEFLKLDPLIPQGAFSKTLEIIKEKLKGWVQ